MHRADPRLSRVSAAIALALALAAGPSLAAPGDYAVKFAPADGESAGKDHKEWIDVMSINPGTHRALGSWSKAEGLNVNFDPGTAAKGNVEYEWKVEEGESAPPPPGDAEITLKGSKIGENAEAKRTPPTVTLKRGTTASTATSGGSKGGVRAARGDHDGDGVAPAQYNPKEYSVSKRVYWDEARKATPKLSEAIANGRISLVVPAGTCTAGARYPSVELAGAGESYRMEDVSVESCSPGLARSGSRPTESMSLNFTKVEFRTISTADGKR